jgi:hypothetical protein
VKKNDNGIETVPVKRCDSLMRMYDRSNQSEDKDNVLLQDCPPPFTYGDKSPVYAIANLHKTSYFAFSDFEDLEIRTSDNYARISDRDLALVFDHSMVQNDNKEFTRRQTTNALVSREVPFVDEEYSSSDINFDSLDR